MSDKLSQHARRVLADRIQGMGGEPKESLDVVRFGMGDLAARCFVSNTEEQSGSMVAMLAFDLKLHEGMRESVHETSIGIGMSEEEAVDRAVGIWVQGVLPPVRAVLGLGEDQVQPFALSQTDPRGFQAARWEVFGGPLQVAGTARDELADALQPVPPFAYLAKQGALPLFPKASRIFWMRVYCARQSGGSVVGECKVNNLDWPLGVEKLSRIAWPAIPGYVMFKQFLAGRLSTTE